MNPTKSVTPTPIVAPPAPAPVRPQLPDGVEAPAVTTLDGAGEPVVHPFAAALMALTAASGAPAAPRATAGPTAGEAASSLPEPGNGLPVPQGPVPVDDAGAVSPQGVPEPVENPSAHGAPQPVALPSSAATTARTSAVPERRTDPRAATPAPASVPATDDTQVLERDAVAADVARRDPAPAPLTAARAAPEVVPSAPPSSGGDTGPIAGAGLAEAARPSALERGAAPPTFRIPVPPGTAQWADSVGDRITWLASGGHQRAELRLNPPELGRIDVRIAVDDGETSVVFVAQNAAVRDALDAAVPRLRELMEQAGLNLADVDVGGSKDGPGEGRGDESGLARGLEADDTSPDADDEAESTPAPDPARGLVDQYA